MVFHKYVQFHFFIRKRVKLLKPEASRMGRQAFGSGLPFSGRPVLPGRRPHGGCLICSCTSTTVLPHSSLKVSSNLICSGVDPPINSVLNSRSVNVKWRTSFCRDFLNHGPLSWSERRSGIGKRTDRFSAGVATCTDTRQFAGLWESSRNTSVKALC